jgi:predicted lipid-binding transport protein (Tim44 family)
MTIMAMDKIDRAASGTANLIERFQRASGQPSGRVGEGQSGIAGTGGSAPAAAAERIAERLEISDKARRLADLRQTLAVARQAYDAIDDGPERAAHLELVRSRLASGHYQTAEVRTQVAERLGGVLRRLSEL